MNHSLSCTPSRFVLIAIDSCHGLVNDTVAGPNAFFRGCVVLHVCSINAVEVIAKPDTLWLW